MSKISYLINGVIGLLILFYPVSVYFASGYFEPWKIACVLLVLLVGRLAIGAAENKWSRPLLLTGLFYCGFAAWSNEPLTLRFYPVLVNAVMFLVFSTSLLSPPSLIERLARLQDPDLPAAGIVYTRRVTQIWCFFFIINGMIALITALWASFEVWSLYNGLIAYLLMGALLGGEYWVRRRQKYLRFPQVLTDKQS